MKDGKIQWHPAFDAALRIELAEDAEQLLFDPEHLLGKKPMQIDELIIKKNCSGQIHKKLGHLFQKHNIIEYKSPDDYLSISDFYKTYAYACLYQSDRNISGGIDPGEVTITFVCSRCPRKMLQHICKYKKMSVKKYAQGIYHLNGNLFPMQLILIHELSPTEYYWLHYLRNDIASVTEAEDIIAHYEPLKDQELYRSVMEVIMRGNWNEMKEARKNMCQALYDLFEEDLKKEKERLRQVVKQEVRQEVQQEIRQEVQQEIRQEVQQEAASKVNKLNCLYKLLAEKNRIADIIKSADNRDYQKRLLAEFGL